MADKFLVVIWLNLIFFAARGQGDQPVLVQPENHSQPVNCVAYSEASNLVATAGDDRKIIVTDLRSGLEVSTILCGAPVSYIKFMPDGRRLLVCDNFNFFIWDIYTKSSSAPLSKPFGVLSSIDLSRDGRFLVTSGGFALHQGDVGYAARLYDLQTGQHVSLLARSTNGCAIDPEGDHLLTVHNEEMLSTVYLWKRGPDSLATSITDTFTLDFTVTSIKISPDGNVFAAAGINAFNGEPVLKIYGLHSGRAPITFPRFKSLLFDLAFSSDTQYLVTSSEEGILKWDWRAIECLLRRATDTPAYSVCFAQEDRYILFSSGKDASIIDSYDTTQLGRTGSSSVSLNQLQFSPVDRLFMVCADGAIRVWDHQKVAYIKTLHWPLSAITAVAASQAKRYFASGQSDGSIELWDQSTLQPFKSLPGHREAITALAFSETQHLLVAGSKDGEVKGWGVDSGDNRFSYPGPGGAINALCLSADGNLLFYAGEKGNEIVIRNLSSGTVRSIYTDDKRITNLVYDPQKALLYYSDNAGNIQVTDTAGNSLDSFLYQYNVDDFVLSPDGRYLISGDNAGYIQIRNVLSNQVVGKVKAHSGAVRSVALSSDKRCIYTIGLDAEVKVWDMPRLRPLSELLFFGEDGWMMITDGTYYSASKNSLASIGFRINEKVYSFDQFDLRFNRPDIVLAKFPQISQKEIEDHRVAWEERLKRIGRRVVDTSAAGAKKFDAPELSIVNLKDLVDQLGLATDNSSIRLHLHARDSLSTLASINVWTNGSPLFGASGIAVHSRIIDTTIPVELTYGVNQLEVSCTNVLNVESLTESFSAHYTPKLAPPRDLYFVGLGVSEYRDSALRLELASRDVTKIGEVLDSAIGHGAGYYANYFPFVRTDRHVTIHILDSVMRFLKKCKPNDVVILFLSGHGVNDPFDRRYYFCPYNADPIDLSTTALSYEQIENLLGNVPSRNKLLVLNTCMSGDYDERSDQIAQTPGFTLMKQLFEDLEKTSGATVLTAAQAYGYFSEFSKGKNAGLLAEILISAIQERNKEMPVMELCQRLRKGLEDQAKLLNDVPEIRYYNFRNNFRIW